MAEVYLLDKGMDFGKSFAFGAKFNTIKCILAVNVAMDLDMHQMDIRSIILNDESNVEIYMEQLEGFVQKEETTLYVSWVIG